MMYSPFVNKVTIDVDVLSTSSTVNSQLLTTLTRQALVSFLDNGSTNVGGAGASAVQTNTGSNPGLEWRYDIFDSRDLITTPDNTYELTRTLLLPAGTPIYGIARNDRVKGTLTILEID